MGARCALTPRTSVAKAAGRAVVAAAVVAASVAAAVTVVTVVVIAVTVVVIAVTAVAATAAVLAGNRREGGPRVHSSPRFRLRKRVIQEPRTLPAGSADRLGRAGLVVFHATLCR